MILDTCYAAKGGSNTAGPTKGANEVIAATNEVIQAPGVSRLSFTRVLVRVLKNFAEKHRTENLQLSAVWLCTHMRNYYYDQELKKPPYYVSLVNYRFESCRIVPRPYSQNRFLGEVSPLLSPDLGPFRAIVAIHLKETPSGDLVSWLQGQGAPAGYIDGVELINIQAAHLANSSMLLVTLPPAVWLLLPPEIPCTFVGMISSGNLFSQGNRATTAKFGPEKTPSSSIEQLLVLNPPPPYVEDFIDYSRVVLDDQLRRQNEYWIDRVAGNSPFAEQYSYYRSAYHKFRLIKLAAGQENDQLIGRLITVDSWSVPQYVALSYVWGPPWEGQDPPSILLDDIAIELRPNLDSAMRALRRHDQDIHIWIDALCINQRDEEEKNMQVPLMAIIYRRSNSVAIWLGTTTYSGKVAFSFAKWITEHPDLVIHVAERKLKVLITVFFDVIRNPWFHKKGGVADIVRAKEVNLHYGKDVLPWEIMAGAVYVLRSRALDLLQLFLPKTNNEDSFLDFLADFSYQGVNAFVDIRDDMQRILSDPLRLPRIRLVELVTKTALLNADIFHDAVYSMMFLSSDIELSDVEASPPSIEDRSGPLAKATLLSSSASSRRVRPPSLEDLFGPLAKATLLSSSASSAGARSKSTQLSPRTRSPSGLSVSQRDLPLVDYKLAVREVCCKFVRYAVRSTGRLDIICCPWAPEASELPSWVRPRSEHAFRVLSNNRYCRANADGLAVLTSISQTLYSACGKNSLLKKSQTSDIFHSEGFLPKKFQAYEFFHSGDFSMIVEGFALGNVDVIAPPAMKGILPKEWRKIGGSGITLKASEDWFWRTLVADRSTTGSACPPWYKLASEHVLQNSDGLDLDTRRLMFESFPGIFFDYLNRVRSVIWGRRLATLKQGYVVLGPSSCEVGDVVCILYGCSVPVILRRRSEGFGYTFIGECYVHGMMDGEAIMLKETNPEGLHTRQFYLI